MTNEVLFKDCRLVDGTGSTPKEHASVVVADGRITEIVEGPAPERTFARTVDAAGHTLLPGLIDTHVHLGAIDVNVLEQHRNYPTSLAAVKIARIIHETLRQGFTTVRDAGGADWGFKAAVEEGLVDGPDLFVAGRPLSQTGGHGDFRRKAELGDPLSCCPELGYVMRVCDGADAVLREAREQLRRGADQVKVMASGGAMSPTDALDSVQFTPAELESAVTAARSVGSYVMAHAIAPAAIRNCVEAGVRSIEHGNLVDDETAALMAKHGTYLVPTLSVYQNLVEDGEKHGVAASSLAKAKAALDRGFEAVAIAQRAGVRIASGSDLLGEAAVTKARELELKAQVIGASAAIVSATRTNAELLGIADETGTVEVGKRADLVLVAGNPLDDLSLLRDQASLRAVVKNGRFVDA